MNVNKGSGEWSYDDSAKTRKINSEISLQQRVKISKSINGGMLKYRSIVLQYEGINGLIRKGKIM